MLFLIPSSIRAQVTVTGWGSTQYTQLPVPAQINGVKALSGGFKFTIALLTNGTIIGWGEYEDGQVTPPAGLTGVTAIASGHDFSLALKSNGTVVGWGGGSSSPGRTIPLSLPESKAIAAGRGHAISLSTSGGVTAWGNNSSGQSSVPSGIGACKAIAAGGFHSLAVTTAGAVVAWGENSAGQRNVPAGLTGVVAVAAGGDHSLALKSDGTVVAWGGNSTGQTTVPAGLSGVIGIAAGDAFSLALKNDGTVVQFGYGIFPVPAGIAGVAAVAAGTTHALAVRRDGTGIGWGIEGDYFHVSGADHLHIEEMDAGEYYSLVRKTDGTVSGWGSNSYGQLNIPASLAGAAAISAGNFHALALRNNNTVAAWGSNADGRATVPASLSDVTAVEAGGNMSLALLHDGTVRAWGSNTRGQLNIPPGLNGVISLAAGTDHVLALRSDGTVAAWGYDTEGQATVPAGLSGVIALDAGSAHSMALRRDGTVVCWGRNGSGQSTVPPGLTDVVAIAAGDDHCIAVKSDGTAVTWGRNSAGQSTVPAGLSGVVAVTAGDSHSLALSAPFSRPKIVGPLVARTDAAGVGEFYYRISALGGPTHFTAFRLPPGISLDETTGILSGAASAIGTFTIGLRAENSRGEDYRQLVLRVGGVPAYLGSAPVALRLRQPVNFPLLFAGKPLVSATGLPPGVQVSSTGIVTGTPTQPGVYEITLNYSNPYGSGTVTWRVTVSEVTAWGGWESTLKPPEDMTGVMAIDMGYGSAMALLENGTVRVWPENSSNIPPAGLNDVIAVAQGSSSVALRSDGTLVAWPSGGSTPPADLTDVVAISSDSGRNLALKSNGTVTAWGTGNLVPANLTKVVKIACGPGHSLALHADGTVSAWGFNSGGATSVPPGLTNVVEIACGKNHSLALKNDGTVVSWGGYVGAQLTPPGGLNDVVGIAGGDSWSQALKRDGTVWTWGAPPHNDAVRVLSSGVVAVVGGEGTSLTLSGGEGLPRITSPAVALTYAGHSFWYQTMVLNGAAFYSADALPAGLNLDQANGLITGAAESPGTFNVTLTAVNAHGTTTKNLKIIVNGLPAFHGTTASNFTVGRMVSESLILETVDSVEATGLPPGLSLNASGLLTGTPERGGVFPARFQMTNGYGSSAAAWTFRVTEVAAWGTHTFGGQLSVPTDLAGVIAVGERGLSQSLALMADGTVKGWGGNYPNPTAGRPIRSISGGYLLLDDGSVPSNPNLSGIVAIHDGENGGSCCASLAVREDGTVVNPASWWDTGYVPSPGLSEVVAVSPGYYHVVALKSNGTVVAWGQNTYGQLDIPPGLSDVVAIAAGATHTLALKSDGSVVAWGDNYSGQTSVPAGLQDVGAIEAVGSRSIAFKADGTLVAWGYESAALPTRPPGINSVAAIYMDEPGIGLALADGRGIPRIISPHAAVTDAAGIGRFHYRIRAVNKPDSFAADGLPGGLTFNSATGVISGAVLQPGTYAVTLSATNSFGTGTLPLRLVVNGLPRVMSIERTVFTIGQPAHARVYFAGQPAVTATGLPPGMTLGPDGTLAGRPTRTGAYDVEFIMTNSLATIRHSIRFDVTEILVFGNTSKVPSGVHAVSRIAAGSNSIAAIRADGSLVVWGDSGLASLPADVRTPVEISAWDDQLSALQPDGSVRMWMSAFDIITQPAAFPPFRSVAAGGYFTAAVSTNGTLTIFSGFEGFPKTAASAINAVATGRDRWLGLRTDGTVVSADIWGNAGFPVPPGLNAVVAVAAGFDHALALRSDGTVVGLGNISPTHKGFLDGLRGIDAVDAGAGTSVALRSDGTVQAWSITPPATLSGVVAVTAGWGGVAFRCVPTPPAQGIQGHVGTPLSFQLPDRSIAVLEAAGLPPGLTFNPATRMLSGVPSAPGIIRADYIARYRQDAGHTRPASRTVPLLFSITHPPAAVSAYAAWASGHGDPGPPEADPDGDEVNNLMELVLGSNPHTVTARPVPQFRRESSGILVMEFDVTVAAADSLTFRGRFSSSLESAGPDDAEVFPEPVAGAAAGFRRLRFTDHSHEGSRRFGRVAVSMP